MAPSHAGRPCHVRQQRRHRGIFVRRVAGALVEPRPIPLRKFPKRLFRLPRQRQQPGSARPRHLFDRRQVRVRSFGRGDCICGTHGGPVIIRFSIGRSVPLQHDVRVGSRYPERAYPGPRRPVRVPRPLRRLGGHAHRQPLPVQVRVRVPEMQVFRNHAPPHRQHRLDQPRNSGGRLQVADVGLHRTDQQRAIRRPSPAVHCRGRLQLDGVAQLGPGSMSFQVVHFRRRHASPRKRIFDHLLLCRTVGHGRPGAGTVLVHRRAQDHAPYAVAVGLRLGQPFQDDHAATLAPHEAVGGGVESLARPLRRQHPQFRHLPGQPGRQHRVDPADQSQIHFTLPQPGHRLVRGHQ